MAEAASQWPRGGEKLAELVAYLCDAETYDPSLHAMGLCEFLSRGLRMRYEGFWTVENHSGLTIHDCFVPADHDRGRPFVVFSQSLTELAVCLLVKRYSAAFSGAYLYNMMSKAVGQPEHPFWVDAWRRISWAMTPSHRFLAVAAVQRPDLWSFVSGCRARLARAFQSNAEMDRAIDVLTMTGAGCSRRPWVVQADSPLAQILFASAKHADVVLAPVPASTADCDLRVTRRRRAAPLSVVMAHRDRILLALYLLFGYAASPEGGLGEPLAVLAKAELPCFRECFALYPCLDVVAPQTAGAQ